MTTLSANKVIITTQIVIVSTITWLLLYAVSLYFGRIPLWILGSAFLFLAGFALFRLRKKII